MTITLSSLLDVITFALELSGAFLALRQKLWSLAGMLTCAALGEGLMFGLSGDSYGYVWWLSQALQYLFFSLIACQVMARLVAHRGKLGLYVGAVTAIVGSLAGFAFAKGETLSDRYLDAEIAGGMALVFVLVVGWASRKRLLEAPWSWIALGMVVSAVGSSACAMLWQVWDGAPGLYYLPAIASLVLWNWASAQEEEKARRFRELAKAAA